MNRICNFVIVYLIVGSNSSISSSQIGDITASGKNELAKGRKNIVYDVTESVNNLLHFQSGSSFGRTDSYVDSSSYLYYRIGKLGHTTDTGKYPNISANDMNYWLASPEYQTVAVSFLERPSQNLLQTLIWSTEQQHLNYFVLHELFPPEIVIYRVSSNRCTESCYAYCPDDEAMIYINQYLFETEYELSGIGLEYNERFIDCCGKRSPYTLQRLKLAILNIQFDSPISVLSYSFFVKQLNIISERNKIFWKEINTNCSLSLQIKVPRSQLQQFSNAQIDLYRAYISEYAKSWSLKHGDNDTLVIVDSFPENVVATPFGREIYQNIHPVLQLSDSYVYISPEWHDVAFSPCQLRKIAETVGQVAENIHLDYFSFNISVMNSSAFECKTVNEIEYTKYPIFPDLHISNIFDSVEIALGIVTMIEQHSGGMYRVKSIYFKNKPQPPLDDSLSTELFWRYMFERKINVGCSVDIATAVDLRSAMNRILNQCISLFERSPLLLLNWPFGIESNDLLTLAIAFKDAVNVRAAFQSIYPNGEVILQPNVRDVVLVTDESITDPEKRVDIYCAEHLKTVYSFNEIIATWAQIHNFTVNLGRVIDAAERGMWHNVYTAPELNRTATDFLVLVRRNVPEMIEGGIEFPYTYSCLHRSGIPNSDISFDTNLNAGITFELSLKKGSIPRSNELQTLLLYSFGKFSNVEIRTGYEKLDLITKALTPKNFDALKPQLEQMGQLRLYIETDVSNLLKSILDQKFGMPVRVHFTGWEYQNFEQNKRMFLGLKKYNHKHEFGLTIQNCIEKMNVNLKNLNPLRNLNFIKYVVCNIKPVLPTNVNETNMQVFLDTNFYVQEYFKEKLGWDVIFRLSFESNRCSFEKSGIENYLTFLNDTNQHAETYGVKYFMGEAFNKNHENCGWSWWRISDSTNLANDAVYTELESKYFDRVTKRKLQILQTITNYKLIIGLSVLSLILVGAVVGVLIYYRRMRNKFLTKTEVHAFRDGIEKSNSLDQLELYDIRKHEAETQPFQVDFEIAKDNIQLGKIVGRGNFGIVYKATLKNTNTVAVKSPSSDCSKETFKTMLSEVKVLCYIGLHENVLRFIGAYTEEIEKGFIYIVTEFCENGCLEKYLRSRKVTTVANHNFSNENELSTGYITNTKISQTVEINELYRFSYEIANGMNYLARRKVVHGDLSTRNVLLTKENVCKIGDFGLSRKLYNKNKYVKQGDEDLPWKWMAIESLKRREFTSKTDVWSFGVTLWEIFTSAISNEKYCIHFGDVPYHGFGWTEDFDERLENGMRLSKPPLVTEETYIIFLQCWNISPDKRPEFFTLSRYFCEQLE